VKRRAFCAAGVAALAAAAVPYRRAAASTSGAEIPAVGLDGRQLTLKSADIEDLRAGLRGELITADLPGYDAARRLWNPAFDRKPALIVRCVGAADVRRAVSFTAAHGLVTAVRGGGHSVSGQSGCDGGLVIDVSPMRAVEVDPIARVARVEAGALLGQLDRAAPGPARDRREITLRLERGFLASAAQGHQSRAAEADFERCLQLGETNLRNDELFATLTAVGNYYLIRADLRRATKVLEVLHAGLEGRQWFRPAIEILAGAAAWLRGDFDAADNHLQVATADVAAADKHKVDADGLLVSDSSATARLYLALVGLVRGDHTSAHGELALAARMADGLGFPWAAYTHAYTRSMATWLRIEAGQFDRAAVVAADTIDHAERYGLDMWPLVGATWQAAVDGLAALDGEHVDPITLGAHIATITMRLETLRTLGVYMYTTVFDAFLGRLLTAAGQPEVARERLDTGLQLAQDTGMHFYDAELLRLRAHTHTAPNAMRDDLEAALTLARRQGARLFELRSALDDFELRGELARGALVAAVSRVPPDRAMPELARARAVMELMDCE